MVIKANIGAWDTSRMLEDKGNLADIIFGNTFDQMKFSTNQIQSPETHLFCFIGNKIDALRKISLPVHIVDLYCPYNAIFGRGFANKFNMAIHTGYLCCA